MIYSKYVPNVFDCLNNMNADKKIEVPSDIYDSAIIELEERITDGNFNGIARSAEATNFILCGSYNYNTAKIIAMSGLVEALNFNIRNGEITSKSAVGISAEITLAFAIWNGYDYNTAIERAILSRLSMESEFLPPLLAASVGKIKINDGLKMDSYIAKKLVSDSTDFIADYFEGTTSDNDLMSEQIKHSLGAIISDFKNEIIFVFKAKNDIADLFRRRISIEQFIKNVTIKIAGTTASTTASVVNTVTFGDPFLALESAKVTRIFAMEKTKKFLDKFITDDNQKMLGILGDKLAEMLNENFLTQYEMEVLMEILHDDAAQGMLKKMYAMGNNQARIDWTEEYLSERVQKIFDQREFIRMPSTKEWEMGFQRLLKKLNNGENIVADMEQLRYQALANLRQVINYYGLKSYDIGEIIRQLNKMKKIQIGMERVVEKIQANENSFKQTYDKQITQFKDLMIDLKNLQRR